jgi:alkanesulfonate monooxygenase SsuD/methylene tetrahydromethanopterin reductase-like flavin-dependent oxidoreductase (luciferase family)
MARIGSPILIGVQTAEDTASRLSTYKSEMLGAGFTEDQTENALNQTWVARNMFVAETESQARELAQEGFARERKHFRKAREIYNPEGFPPLDTSKPLPAGEDFDKTYVIGTASQVADQVAELRDLGVRNLMLKINVGEMDTNVVQAAITLFGENVMPKFAESAS